MGKDPAFLFYPGDWVLGTMGMSLEEKGAYMELLMMQFNGGPFQEKRAIRVISQELWEVVKDKFNEKDGLYFNKRLDEEKKKRMAYSESRRKSRLKSDEDNVRIYIVRDNVRKTHKIGSSVNPIRRYNELNNQKNPAIMGDTDPSDRDITLVWYSDPVLRSEEKVLHEYFLDKHITGEWFNLNKSDIDYIYSKYKGTYQERTIERTEDENKDINENRIKRENVFKSEVHEFKKYPTDLLNEFIDFWTEPNRSGSKMRWESEKTWDLNRRLARWSNNNFGKKQEQSKPQRKNTPDVERRFDIDYDDPKFKSKRISKP